MNGQTRSAPTKDYSQINLIKKIKIIENFRGYKKIYYIKPFINTHFAYLDGEFMGFTVPDGNMDIMFMEAEQAINYYFERINMIFRNPGLEYSQFISKDEYRPYISVLKFKMESDKKENGNKD